MSMNDRRLDVIQRYAESGEPVILWGAGSYTQRLLATTRLGDCNVVALVDNDKKKQGLEIHAFRIESPDVLRQRDGVILIAAAIHAEEIKSGIASLGLRNEIVVIG